MLASLIGTTFLAGLALVQPPELKTETGDFGEVYQFAASSAQFRIVNSSDQPIEVAVLPQRSTDKVIDVPKILAPNSVGTVQVSVVPQDETGVKRHAFDVRVPGRSDVVVRGQVSGFVESVLDEPRPILDFGVVDSQSARTTKPITLTSSDDPEFRIAHVVEAPYFAEVSIADDKRSIQAELREGIAWGIHEGTVKLALDSSKQKQIWVALRADIHGEVVPSSNPFRIDLVHKGQRNEFVLRLDQRLGEDFKLGKVRLEGFQGQLANRECVPVKKGCKLVKLRISDDQPTGVLDGRILINFLDSTDTLSVKVWGILVSAGVQITDLNAEMKKRETNAAALQGGGLHSALLAATSEKSAPISMPTPPGQGPLLKWKVQNERQLYGYIVYRSDSENGVSRRISDQIIRTISTEDGQSIEYQWRDTTARNGETYWYRVGTIDSQGVRRDLSGPIRKAFTSGPQSAK